MKAKFVIGAIAVILLAGAGFVATAIYSEKPKTT